MNRLVRTLGLVLGLSILHFGQAPVKESIPPAQFRWQAEFDAFNKSDRENPPPKGAILFIGSSIFRLWPNLATQMAPLPVFNRAFGGSVTNELIDQIDTFVIPYRPKIIVYYCGSNDVNDGRTALQIFGNVMSFSESVRKKLPGTKIYFVSINKSPQKRDKWDVVDQANAMVKAYFDKTKNRAYIDVNPQIFDDKGNPLTDLYLADLLHFKPAPYVKFGSVIKPILEQAWKKEQKGFCKANPEKCH